MTDDPLRELLSSPLAAVRDRRSSPAAPPKRGMPGLGPWLAVSIVAGALAVVAGYRVVGTDAAVAETTQATIATTEVVVPVGLLPEGYTAVGDRIGMKAERVLVRQDATFVSLSLVVPNTLAPAESSGYQGGLWTLLLTDGRRLASVGESTDAHAPGFVSVEFPADGYTAGDVSAVELVAVAQRAVDDVSTSSAMSFSIPGDGSNVAVSLSPARFTLDAGVEFVVSDITLSSSGAAMSWTLEGDDPDARATVDPYLEFDHPEGAVEVAITRTSNPVYGFFYAESITARPLRREGDVLYDPPGQGPDASFTVDTEVTAVFHATVSWAVFSSESVRIPIGEDVLLADVG